MSRLFMGWTTREILQGAIAVAPLVVFTFLKASQPGPGRAWVGRTRENLPGAGALALGQPLDHLIRLP